MKLYPLLAFCFVSVVFAEKKSAHLLLSKTVLNEQIAVDKDISIHYEIFNVGGVPATNVELTENSFKSTEFQIVSGMLKVKWEYIASMANVSHTVVLKPLVPGVYNVTSARVTYNAAEDRVQSVGFSSEAGEYYIFSEKDYLKRFSSHWMDWLAFGLLTLPSVVFPFLLWYRSHVKYPTLEKTKHKRH